jgi:PAS domain S-box-containing protein
LRDQQGIAYRMAGSITDVTSRKRDEELLKISEERFRLLAKASNDAIWDWDIVSNGLWWNEGFEYLFGHRRDDVAPTLDSWTDFIHPEDYGRVHEELQRVLEHGGTNWSADYRFRCRNGTYAYVHDHGYVIRDEKGTPIRMIGGMSDLSDRKAAEEQLARQAALLDQARDAIIVKDLEDRVLYWNRSAERMYGWTSEEAVGKTSFELIHTDLKKFKDVKDQLFRQGYAYTELEKKTKDNRGLLVETRWSLMLDVAGNPSFILSINTDITEKRKLEQQFFRAQRMESIGTLAGGIAHDLNNILAPILMGLNLLKEDVSVEERHSIVDTLEISARRGAALVKQVLSFARGVQGNRTKIDLRNIIQDLRGVVAETFPKSITCECHVAQGLWSVVADPTNIHQVILNLCVNARDAMPRGGRLVIRVGNQLVDAESARLNFGAKVGPYVVVEVTDTGTGIAESVRAHIFEPFFTTKELGQGTGLGLSTSLGIVKSHEGFITLDSELGKGSTFKVYLPANVSSLQQEQTAFLEPGAPMGNGELILVVDDEAAIRTVAERILTLGGYKVVQACNGVEALAVYGPNMKEIAVVITDMTMPVMDGPALVKALQAVNKNVKIIGSSGLHAPDEQDQPLKSGLKAFLPKPYAALSLLKLMNEVISAP